MSKKISIEQKKAIESRGGTVLSAGAGAGKTFVIIEHIIDLLEVRKEEKRSEGLEHFLSSIIVITFTKKAARELNKRVEDKFKSLSLKDSFWGKVYSLRSNLFVGTIHSFCFTLLKNSQKLDFGSLEIVDEGMIKQIIREKILGYLENKPEILNFYSYKDIQHSLEKIFFDPKLRLSWEEKIQDFSREELITNFFNLFPINLNFEITEEKKLKWIDFVYSFKSVWSEENLVKRFVSINDLFSSIRRLPTPSKKLVSDEVNQFFQEIKEMKSFLKDFTESLNLFEGEIKKQSFILRDLFIEINKNYFVEGKISFSDIEYLMLKEKPRLEVQITEIIIDEFQDVSDNQFQIFKSLVYEDFSKLFVVGDKKQAIYGFRGGEVSVFESLASVTSNNLKMIDNYRSLSNVVNFNNQLFKEEFPDELFQNPQNLDEGEVIIYEAFSELEDRDLKDVETEGLFNVLKHKLDSGREEIALLYRFLAPSQSLIKRLMDDRLSYNCSLKIEKSKDPILSILKHLLYSIVEKQTPNNALFFIKGYLEYLSVDTEGLKEAVKDFHGVIDLLGLSIAWSRFCSRIGLLYGHGDALFSELNQLERYFDGSLRKILYALRDGEDERVLIDVSNSTSKAKIHLMTAHSSKGLEFEDVIVANVLTNSRGRSDKLVLGDTPQSFSYIKDTKRFLTPLFMLERQEGLLKKEKESLRLFYVACTRAVKSLSFIIVPDRSDEVSNKAWGAYLLKQIDSISCYKVEKIIIDKIKSISGSELFHELDFQIVYNPNTYLLGVLPEISVARLSLLKICPYRFYLKEVLGLDEKIIFPDMKSDSEIYSSAERGSAIHKKISEYFLEGKELKKNEFSYLIEILKSYTDHNFISEQEIKFQVEGRMISGTPDLVVVDGQKVEVWDFKTGAHSLEKDKIYQVQIALYLYGWMQVNDKKYNQIISKIIYLDEEKTVESNFSSYRELESEIKELISRSFHYEKIYPDHSSDCPCMNLKPRKELLSVTHDS